MARPGGKLNDFLYFMVQTPIARPFAGGYFKLLKALDAGRRMLLPTQLAVMEAIMGNYLAQSVYVVARLGIADRLKAGPKSANDLATETGADPDNLFRVLRYLATRGIFRRRRDGRFELGRHGAGLLADAESSFKAFAEFNGTGANWHAWGSLFDAVMTGKSAFTSAHGKEFWDFLKGQPEVGEVFDRSMVGFSEAMNPLFAAAYRFESGTVVDVGGGHGALLAGILARNPKLKGVLFDLPEVVADAPEYLAREGVAERVEIVPGSFFDAMPSGHDYYVMKNVLHDWGDDDCIRILLNIARVIAPNGRVVIAEMLVRERDDYPITKAMDLGMMVLTRGGRERTRLEYEGLLAKAGFALEEVVGTVEFLNIMVARKHPR